MTLLFLQCIEKFHFLKVEANKLKKITLPYKGFTSWNGAAIFAVAGQGSLYVHVANSICYQGTLTACLLNT